MTVPEPRGPEPSPVTGGPRGHLRGHHIFWSLIAGLIIVAVAIAVSWLIARPADHESWADVIRSAVLAAGAVAAVPAGYVAYRKQQTTEAERNEAIDKEQRRRDELIEANTRADAKDYRDRYAAASGQLGSDKAAIRLAGVYALAQLADEWGRTEPDQRQVCIDVLCAYLRMPWPTPTVGTHTLPIRAAGRRVAGHISAPSAPRPPAGPREVAEETQVRAAILGVTAHHVHRDHDPETAWWANEFDLSGADKLPQCDFNRARLDGEFNVQGATFSNYARFADATFSNDAWFGETKFSQEAWFEGATFSRDAWFVGATFSRVARFVGATFSQDAWFVGATFSQDAWFEGATFSQDAVFDDATFSQGAGFEGATFSEDAGFEGATFSEDVRFKGATLPGATSLRDPGNQAATVVGEVVRPDGTLDPATPKPRPLERALFPKGRLSS